MPELDELLNASGWPWILVILYAFTAIDGFFPPVPSESIVIVLAALLPAGGEPTYWLLGAVAALGAFTGDQIAYSIGRRIPVRRMPAMRSERAQKALTWAERALAFRGAAFIIGARFIPVGRVAVNMTAGTVRFPRLRFSLLAAVAAVTWSVYSVGLGVGAGHLLGHPLLAVLLGVAGGIFTGAFVDYVLQRVGISRQPAQPAMEPSRRPDG